MKIGPFFIRILFEPRDLWVGVYWKTYWEGWSKRLNLYVCILPMLPILIDCQINTSLDK